MSDLPQHIVAVHSVPRSGSSWLGQIFKSSPHVEFRFQPLWSYAFKDFLGPDSNRDRILEFVREIRSTNDDYVLQRVPDLLVEYPDLGERKDVSHLVWKEVRYHHILANLMRSVPEIKVVGLIRHPCAVIDSWLRAPREFKADWDMDAEWRNAPRKNLDKPEEFNGFSKWLEVAELFLELETKYPDRFKLVRYADLNEDPLTMVKELFDFCDLPFEESTRNFISASRSKDVHDANSIYRLARPDNGWVDRLPDRIASKIIEETTSHGMTRFLK